MNRCSVLLNEVDLRVMNVRLAFLITALGCAFALRAQSKYDGDNTRYRTISLEELPAALAKSPEALMLDVRTPGEFSDTSHWTSLNIGHLKGAANIDDREVGRRLSELPDRNRPIYLYCSHSQRSRRVGNLLADSGYTNVINVNGGMSRYWNEQDRLPMMDGLIERSVGYGIVNPNRLCEWTAQRPVFFLDVRPDSLFEEVRRPEWMNAFGSITGSTRIPAERLSDAKERIPWDRPIVVVANETVDETLAALELQKLGVTDVHILFEGLESLIDLSAERCPCKDRIWKSDAPYSTIGLDQLDSSAILAGTTVVIDIRPTDEYDGIAKTGWANLGRFRIARHVPAAEMKDRMGSLGIAKETPVVLVGRTMEEDLFSAARTLTDMGYTQVKILSSGIWGIRWEAHNLPGLAAWDTWVIPYAKAKPQGQ